MLGWQKECHVSLMKTSADPGKSATSRMFSGRYRRTPIVLTSGVAMEGTVPPSYFDNRF